jgi:hypothetical protein
VKFFRLRRRKATCSLSYVDYRPKTNAAIFWDSVESKEISCTGGIEQGQETKNLNVVDVLSVQE